ncbi:hypothetical protein VHEMI09608 [[Torrubiella] hemipterigena]|uniref:Carboxylic ester hydrolase n=1 Tax=[Torrubiella] hemipterigena TaxID=1531966 RepID=A0A0A1TRS8_9HYPO|nr:hypothetical protein VHEMI09608 [[Torrubiella] hemipterigena]
MKFSAQAVASALCLSTTVFGAPAADTPEKRFSQVKVSYPEGSVIGNAGLIADSFKGIPFAKPPVGDLRLRPPQRLSGKAENVDGTKLVAPACPQMYVSNESHDILSKLLTGVLSLPLLDKLNGQEDCLTLDIQRPAGTKAGDKLPVVFWIFGGAFHLGGSNTYDATSLLTEAVGNNQPFVFVAINYRVGGFGFLGGKEILKDGAANLGLLDQRMAMEWVADNIDAFGGDPSKVTLWGESAGAISIFDQFMLYGGNATYKGKDLFRAGIMDSGSAVPAEPVDSSKPQAIYDTVVARSGCAGSSDTLACLRKAPYDVFYKAATSVPGALSYNSVALSYLPRPDGKTLPANPLVAAKSGKFKKVPVIIGDQEDEGTLFSLFQNNVTTTNDIVSYLKDLFFPRTDVSILREIVNVYPEDISAGSPFRTGIFNELYPGFKRLAALLGDITFTITRRVTLRLVHEIDPTFKAWSYLSSYDYGTPILGTFHASDILQAFYGVLPNNASRSIRAYYFNFVYNLDPNKGYPVDNWPEWGPSRTLMWFKSAFSNSLLKDDFRKDAEDVIYKYREDIAI